MEYNDLGKPQTRDKVASALQHLATISVQHDDTAAARRFNKAAFHLADPAFQARWSCGDLLIPSGTRSGVIYRVSALRCSCEASEHGASCWHLGLLEAYQLAFQGVVPESVSQALEAAARPESLDGFACARGAGKRRMPVAVADEAEELFGGRS